MSRNFFRIFGMFRIQNSDLKINLVVLMLFNNIRECENNNKKIKCSLGSMLSLFLFYFYHHMCISFAKASSRAWVGDDLIRLIYLKPFWLTKRNFDYIITRICDEPLSFQQVWSQVRFFMLNWIITDFSFYVLDFGFSMLSCFSMSQFLMVLPHRFSTKIKKNWYLQGML